MFSLFTKYIQDYSYICLINTNLSVVQYDRDQPFWAVQVATTNLKIRKSKFSVFKHYFRGRRISAGLVSCEETQSQVLSTFLQGVKKNQSQSETNQVYFYQKRTNDNSKW